MSNTYRARTQAAEAAFSVGVFEAEFTAAEEKDWLDSGLLELVPRQYRVLSDNYELPQGNTFIATMLVEVEAMLIDAGHIERADEEPQVTTDDEPVDTTPDEEQ